MHSSWMRTARSLTVSNSMWMQIPLDAEPLDTDPPDAPPGCRASPLPVNRMTDMCKNVTFANFFAGGKNKLESISDNYFNVHGHVISAPTPRYCCHH